MMKKKAKINWDYVVLGIIVIFVVILSHVVVRVGLNLDDPLNPNMHNLSLEDLFTRFERLSTNDGEPGEIKIISFTDAHSRKDLAMLIDSISSYDPKVIGLDYTFHGETEYDSILVNSICRASNIVIPYNNPLLANVKSGNISKGRANLTIHSIKEIERCFIPFYYSNGDTIPSFATAIVRQYSTEKYQKLMQRNNRFEHINFHRNYKFDTISWKEVIEPTIRESFDPEDLKDKIVLIGAFVRNADRYLVPMGNDMSGLEIHASAINTILQEDYVFTIPLWVSYVIAILISIIFILLLYVSRVKWNNMGNVIIRISQLVLALLLLYIGTTLLSHNILINFTIVVTSIALSAIVFDLFYGIYSFIISKISKS